MDTPRGQGRLSGGAWRKCPCGHLFGGERSHASARRRERRAGSDRRDPRRHRRARLVGRIGIITVSPTHSPIRSPPACSAAWARSFCIPRIWAKPFRRLLGTSCTLTWREAGGARTALVHRSGPSHRGGAARIHRHPARRNVRRTVRYPRARRTRLFRAGSRAGEALRAGCVFRRGRGKAVLFQPRA